MYWNVCLENKNDVNYGIYILNTDKQAEAQWVMCFWRTSQPFNGKNMPWLRNKSRTLLLFSKCYPISHYDFLQNDSLFDCSYFKTKVHLKEEHLEPDPHNRNQTQKEKTEKSKITGHHLVSQSDSTNCSMTTFQSNSTRLIWNQSGRTQ